jgi:hypothetical protein
VISAGLGVANQVVPSVFFVSFYLSRREREREQRGAIKEPDESVAQPYQSLQDSGGIDGTYRHNQYLVQLMIKGSLDSV